MANLRPFEHGRSGNLLGNHTRTPRGIRAYMQQVLAEKAPEKIIEGFRKAGFDPKRKNMSVAEAVAYYACARALSGNERALELLLTHTEIPLKQEIELSGQGGGPVQLDIKSSLERKLEEYFACREQQQKKT